MRHIIENALVSLDGVYDGATIARLGDYPDDEAYRDSLDQAHPTFLGEWTKAVSNYALKEMPAIGQAVAGKPDNTQAAAQLGVPTVVIHGKDDAAIPVETGVQAANRIPDAKLVRLSAVGHCPPLEAPSAVAAEVIQLAEASLYQQ
jgi:pimeloyl-ACP methyl ester carboxylesterase